MGNATANQPDRGYLGIRGNAAWIDLDAFQCIIKISGEGSLEFLNHHLPGKLFYLHPYSAAKTVVLDDDLKIVDLVEVINMESYYLLVGSRSSREKVMRLLDPAGFDVVLADLGAERSLVSVEGPYAWRAVQKAFGSDILGLGIHSAMEVEGNAFGKVILVRSGCSGEYGYQIISARDRKEQVLAQLNRDEPVPPLALDDLALVALETRMPLFGYSIHEGDCPFENELRYMLDFFKEDSRFQQSLKTIANQPGRSVIGFKAGEPVAPASAVTLAGRTIGQVRVSGYSHAMGSHFGYALLEAGCAYPCGDGRDVVLLAGAARITTLSSPLLTTLSTSVIKE